MMQDWIHSVGINPLTDEINSLTPWIHLDLFVCPYGRDPKDMAWGTDSCHRLYCDMTPTLFFETLSSLGPEKVVTFDWPCTSEATACFPDVFEQDPSIWMNWQAVTGTLNQNFCCCCMQWENDRPVNSWNRIQTWVTDQLISHPTGYHHTIFLLVFGDEKFRSMGSLYNHTCGQVTCCLGLYL